ncbi:MAG: hypothetical protein IJC16_00060 [Rikenellaceae bacterium]|nr:hypothetical protein [Rikenellaceae bacterium]
MDFRIIDLKEERARKAARFEMVRRLYGQRLHNAEVTQRYLRRYGSRLTMARRIVLGAHLADLTQSLREMCKEYTDLSRDLAGGISI